MNIRGRWVVGLACGLLVAAGARGAEPVVLAVPAQHALVNLAFDLADCFPSALRMVCYRAQAGTVDRVEVYDRAAGRWQDMGKEGWASGAGLSGSVILVSVDAAAGRLEAAPWATRTLLADGRRPHEVANAVNRLLPLSEAQWRQLAAEHGFRLVDRNADARREGRYGRPQARPAAVVMPAATEDEELAEEPITDAKELQTLTIPVLQEETPAEDPNDVTPVAAPDAGKAPRQGAKAAVGSASVEAVPVEAEAVVSPADK